MERVREKLADGRVLSLLEGMLQAGVMDTAKGRVRQAASGCQARKGGRVSFSNQIVPQRDAFPLGLTD
jgi:hypothetical protein